MPNHTNDDLQVRISPSIVVFAVFFLLLIYFLTFIQSILILLFMAFIVMVAVDPIVNKLHVKTKLPRIVSIILVYIFFITLITTLTGIIIPPLVSQLYQLIHQVNLPFIQSEIRNLTFSLAEIGDLVNKFGGSISLIYSLISSTFSSIFTLFTILILSFYLTLDRPYLHQKICWLTKNEIYVQMAKEFLDSLEKQLGGWVRGQIILMTVIGMFTYAGLSLLSIPFALPLAILAGMLEILPNLGPTISAIPAIAIAFFEISPVMGGIVLLFYILLQQTENSFIVPKIMKSNADVNPLVAIVSILIGFEIHSIVGAFLAVPTYILIRTTYSLWVKYSKKTLF